MFWCIQRHLQYVVFHFRKWKFQIWCSWKTFNSVLSRQLAVMRSSGVTSPYGNFLKKWQPHNDLKLSMSISYEGRPYLIGWKIFTFVVSFFFSLIYSFEGPHHPFLFTIRIKLFLTYKWHTQKVNELKVYLFSPKRWDPIIVISVTWSSKPNKATVMVT